MPEQPETQLQAEIEQLRAENSRLASALKQSHDSMQEHEEKGGYTTALRLSALMENLQTGILIEDENRIILQVNPKFCTLFGLPPLPEALVGMECTLAAEKYKALFADPERFVQRVTHLLRERRPISNEDLPLADGRTLERDYVPILLDADSTGHLWQYRDITERKRLEQELRRTQKAESLERMASGIAHDYNNLLTAIQGYAGLARQEAAPDSDLSYYLNNIEKAAERAGNLTHQLLAFARRQESDPVEVNLNDYLLATEHLLRPLCGAMVEMTLLPGSDLGKVRMDQGQFEQILLNLVANACDAMPDGGKLIIETRPVMLDAEYARLHVAVMPGPHVLLSVSDTGNGMTEEVKAHLFDPFYTTKRMGQGAGLGLSTCYGIVQQSGGHIQAYSEPGHGTTLKIYLPCVDAPPAPTAEPEAVSVVGTETILLVEDEPMVRDIAAQTLLAQDYNVLEASHGEEALRLAESHQGDIHLLMTDMVMPQMGGKELAERLRKSRPGILVLYTSGYSDASLAQQGNLAPGMDFLQKPFTSSSLTRKVRELLDTRSSG